MTFLFFLFSFITSAHATTAETLFQYDHGSVSNNLGDWNDVNLITSLQFNADQSLVLELDSKSHFHESGVVGGATFTQGYNADWYQTFSLSDSTNHDILTGISVFTEINRKLTAEQKIVVGLGVGTSQGADPYHDTFLLGEVTFYYIPGVTLQTGLRFNRSEPGDVTSLRSITAIAWAMNERNEFLYRLDFGNEGYQVIGAGSFTNKITSSNHYFQWRHFFTEKVGAEAGLEFYSSSAYSRTNESIGLLYRY